MSRVIKVDAFTTVVVDDAPDAVEREPEPAHEPEPEPTPKPPKGVKRDRKP